MKKIFAKIVTSMLALMCVMPQTIVHAESIETVNNLGMGAVGINIKEYELDANGKEVPYQDFKTILPGQTVDKISRITNTGEPAWIRCKLSFVSEAEMENLDESMVKLADGWLKKGDYYYWTKALPTNGTVDFTKTVTFPAAWTEALDNEEFQIIISADAVQQRNFTPDFTADDPWFGTMIEVSMYEKSRVRTTDDKAFEVVYRNGTEGLFSNTEDFFKHWGTAMPGDVLEDTLKVKNAYSVPIEIFFSTQTIADDILIKELGLEIKDGSGKVIFSGKMSEAMKEISLVWLEPGQETTLSYKVTVPASLTNKYAMMNTKTKWIFRAVIHPKDKTCQEIGYPAGYQWDETKQACVPTQGSHTGVEGNNIFLPLIIVIGGLGVIAFLLGSDKKKKKKTAPVEEKKEPVKTAPKIGEHKEEQPKE